MIEPDTNIEASAVARETHAKVRALIAGLGVPHVDVDGLALEVYVALSRSSKPMPAGKRLDEWLETAAEKACRDYFHRPQRRQRMQREALFETLLSASCALGNGAIATRMPEVGALTDRFIRDRSGLSPVEVDDLITGLRREPAAASLLRALLQQSDLTEQEQIPQRRNFLADLGERLADEDREQMALTRQVVELRTADRTARSSSSINPSKRLKVMFAAALLIAAAAVGGLRFWPGPPTRLREESDTSRQLWPIDRESVIYLYSPLETGDGQQPLMVARNPQTGRLRITPLEPQGSAVLIGEDHCFELSGGYLVSHDAGNDIVALCRPRSELTLEVVWTATDSNQSDSQIVVLASDEQPPNFFLAQHVDQAVFSLTTESELVPSSVFLPLNPANKHCHVAVTFSGAELVAYLDGMPIARSQGVDGTFGNWKTGTLTIGADADGKHAWRGKLQALALYDRRLSSKEIAESAAAFRRLSTAQRDP